MVNKDTEGMNNEFIEQLPPISDPENDKIDCKIEGIDGRKIKFDRETKDDSLILSLIVDRQLIREQDFKIHKVNILYRDQYMSSNYKSTIIEVHILKIQSKIEALDALRNTNKTLDKRDFMRVKQFDNYGMIVIDFGMDMLVP